MIQRKMMAMTTVSSEILAKRMKKRQIQKGKRKIMLTLMMLMPLEKATIRLIPNSWRRLESFARNTTTTSLTLALKKRAPSG